MRGLDVVMADREASPKRPMSWKMPWRQPITSTGCCRGRIMQTDLMVWAESRLRLDSPLRIFPLPSTATFRFAT